MVVEFKHPGRERHSDRILELLRPEYNIGGDTLTVNFSLSAQVIDPDYYVSVLLGGWAVIRSIQFISRYLISPAIYFKLFVSQDDGLPPTEPADINIIDSRATERQFYPNATWQRLELNWNVPYENFYIKMARWQGAFTLGQINCWIILMR